MMVGKADVNKYLEHTMSDPMIKYYMGKAGKRIVLQLPVCPKCEKVGLRDKGWVLNKIMACPHCGYRGPTTHQLSAYLKEAAYK